MTNESNHWCSMKWDMMSKKSNWRMKVELVRCLIRYGSNDSLLGDCFGDSSQSCVII